MASSSEVRLDENTNVDLEQIAYHMKPEIERYLALSETINELKAELRGHMKDRKQAEENILKCMRSNSLIHIKASDGFLTVEEKRSPSSLNKDMVKEYIANRIDGASAEDIADDLFRNRPLVQRTKLKLVKNTASQRRA